MAPIEVNSMTKIRNFETGTEEIRLPLRIFGDIISDIETGKVERGMLYTVVRFKDEDGKIIRVVSDCDGNLKMIDKQSKEEDFKFTLGTLPDVKADKLYQ
jgi:hypothetical protein